MGMMFLCSKFNYTLQEGRISRRDRRAGAGDGGHVGCAGVTPPGAHHAFHLLIFWETLSRFSSFGKRCILTNNGILKY